MSEEDKSDQYSNCTKLVEGSKSSDPILNSSWSLVCRYSSTVCSIMPHIFVRSTMNQENVDQVFEGSTTYIDFHSQIQQNHSLLFRNLSRNNLPLTLVNDIDGPGWKTYKINAPAYVVLDALETCDYKVVAASSTAVGTQYMWTLQGPFDREVRF